MNQNELLLLLFYFPFLCFFSFHDLMRTLYYFSPVGYFHALSNNYWMRFL